MFRPLHISKGYTISLALTVLLSYPSFASDIEPALCDSMLTGLIKYSDDTDFTFMGLTTAGMERLTNTAKTLQATEAAYNNVFEAQESILSNHILTMVTRQNHLVLGPPGAAKTAGIDWLLPGIWTKQVAEDMSLTSFFGGLTEAGLREGREDINTKGSIIEAMYALIDEIPNANPSLLAGLLAYLNPGERRITIRGQKLEGRTRAIFSTGNATRPEILMNFWERGLQSGPAMLNRFLFKSFVPNWLHEAQQARLDQVYKRIDRLKAVLVAGTDSQRDRAKEQLKLMLPQPLDVEFIGTLADSAFETSPLLEQVARDLANRLRQRFNDETRKSKSKVAENNSERKQPFESTTEWSERIRRAIMQTVRASAALDLMRLSDKTRTKLLKGPIELSPMSLWRAFQMSVTTGSGISYFDPRTGKVVTGLIRKTELDHKSGQSQVILAKPDIEALKATARDDREALQWADMEFEVEAFNDDLSSILKEVSRNNQEIHALLNMDEDADVSFDSSDFESAVFRERWMRLANDLSRREAARRAPLKPASNPK